MPRRDKRFGMVQYEVEFTRHPSDETTSIVINVEYSYRPGAPAFTPAGEYAPIDPPEGPEIEFEGFSINMGDQLEPIPELLAEKLLLDDEKIVEHLHALIIDDQK